MTYPIFARSRTVLLAATMLSAPLALATAGAAHAQCGVGASVQFAPPVLPVYAQPPMPEAGYLWTPGYWAWAEPAGYYWIPGTWVRPPSVGVLWTPPYWALYNGSYVFHTGYWGAHVGFYGGVNYGHGYGGVGYQGGRWDNGHFAYNQSVNNFGAVHVENAYRQNVPIGNQSHLSFAGARGGIPIAPRTAERAAENEAHMPVTAEQTGHFASAVAHPGLAAGHDNGRPEIAATSRPGEFQGPGVVRPQAQRAAPVQHPGFGQQRTPEQHAAGRQGPEHEGRGRER